MVNQTNKTLGILVNGYNHVTTHLCYWDLDSFKSWTICFGFRQQVYQKFSFIIATNAIIQLISLSLIIEPNLNFVKEAKYYDIVKEDDEPE